MTTTAMTLDRWQGDDEQGRKFGYICGDDGGWFFTHMPTLAETLDSLEEDEVDGDGGVSATEARRFLKRKLTEKPLKSFV